MIETANLIDSNKNPIILFSKWFEEAKQKEINEPNAMNLATISNNLKLSSRIVLLKSFDEKGFVFYTNAKSKKGNSIISNPHVALNFHWKSLFRQIRIEGIAEQVSENEADEYFESRPKESKIGAWASEQSQDLTNRKELEEKYKKFSQKFRDSVILRPSHWTGFRVKPTLFEFWQEMPFRLHDRVEYKKNGKIWSIKRLYP
mgnify:CR=1 FL=1